MGRTEIVVSHTSLRSGSEAGLQLAEDICRKMGGRVPDAVIVFASSAYSYEPLLAAIQQNCNPANLVGCSSAGEFCGSNLGSASASAMAIRSDDIAFHSALGRHLSGNRQGAIAEIMPAFPASAPLDYPYRSALVLTDALAGYADELVHELIVETNGMYQLFGGGAADDAKFSKTHVFHGQQAVSDAVVVLGMQSRKPIGIGVMHGWEPVGKPMRVTQAEGMRLISMNAIPAVEVFEQFARDQGKAFDRENPLSFFLHAVIGIDTGSGYKIRVPLTVNDDGSIGCATEIPTGALVHLMRASTASACEAARHAAQKALAGLRGENLAGSLVFDCAATRLRLGAAFEDELAAVGKVLKSDNYTGCNTYGQIARAEGQFSGFHNCTAIVCAIPG